MATLTIPKPDFIPHPEGQYDGIIYQVEDLGMQETNFGMKHQVSIKIEALECAMEDGQPFTIQRRVSLSGHQKSTLRKLREQLLGKKLTDDEAYNFDTEELVGIRVGYIVEHNESAEGRKFANIANIWPLKDQKKGEIRNKPNDDDLPF